VQRFHVALERLVANEYQDLVRTVHQAERVIGRQDYCHEVLWAALDAVAWRKDRLRAVGLL
jgi:hypothetical protein